MKKTSVKKPYRFIQRSDRNIQVIFRYLPGKLFSTGTRDISEAVRFAEDFLETEGMSAKKTPLLSEFAKDFFIKEDSLSIRAKHKAFGKMRSPAWYKQQQSNVDRYILPRFSKYPLNSITALMIEDWITNLKKPDGSILASDSKCKIIITLNLIMEEAIRRGYISSNPVDHAYKPKAVTEKPRRALTLYEQRTLFPASADERLEIWDTLMWTAYFSFLFDTGFRPSEIAGLRVCDVYKTPGGMGVYTTHTVNAKERKPVERVKTTGKGMERRVGLLSDISEELVLKLIEEEKLLDEDWLFLTSRSDKDKPSFVYAHAANDHMREVCRKMKLKEDLTQYSLRHTYATYRRGMMDETALALSMGHTKGVRDDYDHRTASILLAQLEKSREDIFREKEDDTGIAPLKTGERR